MEGNGTTTSGPKCSWNLSARRPRIAVGPSFGNSSIARPPAVAGQQLPNGYYHLGRMITAAARNGVEVGLCGTCMDARGITDAMVVPEAHRSNLDEVTDWTLWADRTVTF